MPLSKWLGRTLNPVEERHAPRQVFASGRTELLRSAPRVSVVGSRRATEAGLRRAVRLSTTLAQRKVTVVSGLAEGIDTAAHSAAIEAGGETIAVLGTPLDEAYPAKNRDLQNRLQREYLVLSQFHPGRRTFPGNFPLRNRTMALLSDATVVVEAKDRSGSLHQGWEALRLGRPLFMFAASYNDVSLSWPRELFRYGAEVLEDDAEYSQLFDVLPEAPGEVLVELAF